MIKIHLEKFILKAVNIKPFCVYTKVLSGSADIIESL